MKFRIEKKGVTFYIGLHRTQMVEGVNSRLPSGRHWLMWDFDDTELELVKSALITIQHAYKLPRIWIIPTGKPDCYHANCFVDYTWEEARAIIAATTFVDKKFLAIGILREFFTLRYSEIKGREFEQAIILPSKRLETVNPFELTSFATYPKKRR